MSKMDEYKHPQWQKKRLEALERSAFTCCRCGENEKTLHVHHKRYPKGKIWDCDIHDLSVLCESCHKEIEDLVSFSREHGVELHKVFDLVFVDIKPIDVLQMFISSCSGQFSKVASGAFSVATSGIEIVAMAEKDANPND